MLQLWNSNKTDVQRHTTWCIDYSWILMRLSGLSVGKSLFFFKWGFPLLFQHCFLSQPSHQHTELGATIYLFLGWHLKMDTNTVGLFWLQTNAAFYQLQKNRLSCCWLDMTETGGCSVHRCVVSLKPVFFLLVGFENMKRELINFYSFILHLAI